MRNALALFLVVAACRETSPPTAAPSAAPRPEPPASVRPAAPPPAPVRRDAGPPRTIAGRVTDLAGYPVAGARVGRLGATVATDDAGDFAVSVSGSDPVTIEAPGYRTARVAPPSGTARLDVVLVPIGTVGGTVLGGRHAVVRIAGSGIWPPRETEADALGRYGFDDVPEGVYELDAAGEGFAAAPVFGVAVEGPGGAATADLVAQPAVRLVGRVTSSDRAVPAARVRVRRDRFSLLGIEARTDGAGRYRLERLPPGVAWLRVEAAGHPPAPAARLSLVPPLTVHDVTLSRGAHLQGQVTTHEGRPAAGARLSIRATGAAGPMRLPPVVADARGFFAASGVPAGRIRVLGTHPASAPAATTPFEIEEGERRTVTLTLAPPCTLVGRVFDDLGNSVDGARLVLADPDDGLPRRVMHAGEGGRFRVERLPPGPVEVSASAPDLAPARVRARVAPDRETRVELRLYRGGVSIGGLVTGPDGEALRGARVTVIPPRNTASPRHAVTDEVGHFRVAGLAPGRYDVLVEHDGLAPLRVAGVDGSEALDVRLGRGGRLALRVRDPEGRAIPGASVTLRRLADGVSPVAAQATVREADGTVRLDALPPGRYSVLVEAAGFETLQRDDVEVHADEGTELELDLVRARAP